MLINTFRNCLIISYGVQYFSTFAKVIRLSVKPAMIAKLPPSKKLSLVSRRGKGKRVSQVMSLVEKKKKEFLTLTSCMDFGQVKNHS